MSFAPWDSRRCASERSTLLQGAKSIVLRRKATRSEELRTLHRGAKHIASRHNRHGFTARIFLHYVQEDIISVLK